MITKRQCIEALNEKFPGAAIREGSNREFSSVALWAAEGEAWKDGSRCRSMVLPNRQNKSASWVKVLEEINNQDEVA